LCGRTLGSWLDDQDPTRELEPKLCRKVLQYNAQVAAFLSRARQRDASKDKRKDGEQPPDHIPLVPQVAVRNSSSNRLALGRDRGSAPQRNTQPSGQASDDITRELRNSFPTATRPGARRKKAGGVRGDGAMAL
jgi:hypothetical protein